MNTGLGLSFLRFVNEEGSNGWAQVYARIPFDEVELKTKGALLGAVSGKESDGWAELDAELMTWVDEYFNGSEEKGRLADFFGHFRNKYPDLAAIWIWITVGENNKRELKLARWGEAGVMLFRSGKEFDLTTNLEEGKIIHGSLMEGDGLTLWTPFSPEKKEISEDENLAEEWSRLFKEQNKAVAGLIFKIGKFEEVVVEVEPEEVEAIVVTAPQEEERVIMVPEKEELPSQELVGDRFVGPIGLKEKILNFWKKKRPDDSRELVINRDTSKRKKWAGLLGVLFLLLLAVSIVTGSLKMRAEAETKRWQSFSEPIEKSMQEALDLSKINPSGAKKIMEEVRTNFEAKKADFINGKYKKDLADLEKKIGDGWVIVSGEKQSQIEEVANIGLVRPDFKGEKLSLIKDNQFLVLDRTMGTVVTAETKTKDVKVVAGKGGNQNWIDVSGDGKTILIMSKSGIAMSGKDSNVISFDSAVVNPLAMGRFNGNVYVLDQGNKEIFKYGALSDGFGERSRWLKQGQLIDIIPVDMAIDSDIWVLSENGQVEKFRRGSREQFATSGLPSGIKASRLAVDLVGDNLALLDPTNGVVVMCSKTTGNCNQQLKADSLKMATDVEFDSSSNLMVLLPGSVGILK